MRQTARLISLAEERGYKVNAPRDPERRGGTVAIDVPHGYEVTQVLLSRDILVDYRVGAGIRAAPFFFNTDDEIDTLMGVIDDALRTAAWEKFSGLNAVVT
jgi:kynureninase